MVRLAAIGDIHAHPGNEPTLRGIFSRAQADADLLLIAGDLTEIGLKEEAEFLGRILDDYSIPVFAVLGNHDFHHDQEVTIREVLERHGVCILDGDGVVFEHGGVKVGVAGVVGFGGGFRPFNLTPFGEREWKQLYGKIVEETRKLDRAFAAIGGADYRIGLMHYGATAETMGDEPADIHPFLGSSELGDALERFEALMGIHGHAHRGRLEGCTANGIPVFNVALPIIDCPVVWELRPPSEYENHRPPVSAPVRQVESEATLRS